MDYELANEKRYFYDLSTDEQVIDLYQRGYSVPYIADRLKVERRQVIIILNI